MSATGSLEQLISAHLEEHHWGVVIIESFEVCSVPILDLRLI